ncbi:MAG: hypothetical protein CMD27_02460 [Flavobacteriales bacterium]|nr:hypothetical protein [Flavobacteriales bacterium]
MKENYSIIFLIVVLFGIELSAQQDLTLEDAVLKRWTSLNPERLKDLKWNNEDDFFSYQSSDTTIYLCNYNNEILDSILLPELNIAFQAEDLLLKLPSISWISRHTFRFRNNNKFYIYNTERGLHPKVLFNIKENATNIDFNNQNEKYAYTIDNNLFVARGSGNHIAITEEDNSNIIFGQAVHRYEFGIYKGTFWSNDGSKLAFYRKDESMVTDYPLMNTSSRVGYSDIIKYPMAGMTSHHVTLGVYDFNNNKTIYLETGEPKEQYLTNIAWSPDDKYVFITVLNRGQNHLKLNKYSAIDGTFIATLFEEKSDKYVQPLHPIEFISKDKFLWRSEREGYDNLYLYDINGLFIKKILNKPLVVKDYYGYKDDNIYFTTYSKDGLGVDLWNVSINKRYKKKIVGDGSYHSFKISPSKNYFINQYSNLDTPLITQIINNKGNLIAQLLQSIDPLKNYNIGETHLVKIKTEDNIDLNARIIKPYSFDEDQKYPALLYVYNGPGIQLIHNNWMASAPLWMHYLANEGYVVFTIDGRGSENRGRDFEQVIFGELGKIEMEDQIIGYNYLKRQDFVDTSRIAVHGWSYGGFMTTNLLLNYPNLFTCGVAGGPVTNWLFYEIMYTERYMGHPDDNVEGYEKTNLINKAGLLEDPLLMIHGLVDDVVLPQHSLNFLQSAVDNNIQMDYFLYPGHPHNVRGKDRLHLMEKIINFIKLYNR